MNSTSVQNELLILSIKWPRDIIQQPKNYMRKGKTSGNNRITIYIKESEKKKRKIYNIIGNTK